jgi:hypothetical protein
MVVLRDGEWSVWCRCGWRSPPSPALSQLAVRHPCGSGGTPATRGRRAAVPLQGGCLSDSHGDMRTGPESLPLFVRLPSRSDNCLNPPALPSTAVPMRVQTTWPHQPGHAVSQADGHDGNTTVAPGLAWTRGDVKPSYRQLNHQN